MDPIEKKPLYHYHPGEQIFSIGTVGCNLDCQFCQNYHISRYFDNHNALQPERYSAPDLADAAVDSGSFAIAYTYSEPVVWFEFVEDLSRLARDRGLRNVWVTNGFIESAPLKEAVPFIDAMNIDLKAFTDKSYRDLRGKLDLVLKTIETCFKSGVHIEITTLVVPGVSDDPTQLEGIARWIASIDKRIPYHLSRYFPRYHFSKEATDLHVLNQAKAAAKSHLDYVYLGNTMDESDTLCPACGNTLIERRGYSVGFKGVVVKDGKPVCSHCGRPADVVTD
jgi:pyruvate formate lyase activating enzyme